MSFIRCDDCENWIDTDHDAECFVDRDAPMNIPIWRVLCERCREREWDRQEQQKMEDAP